MDPLTLLAQPRRAAIIKFVWRGERSAGDIARVFDVTFGAISQHLTKLTDAGLLVRRQDGRRAFYAANRAALGPLAAALEEMWFGKLTALKSLAEDEQRRLDTNAASSSRNR